MTVQCIECEHYSYGNDKGMAKVAFGNCRFEPKWVYPSPVWPRQCDRFMRTNEETISHRVVWLERIKKNRGELTDA